MEKDQQSLAMRTSEHLEDARQNSPTLAGALVPGSQGAVRVWGPDARTARRNRALLLCWAASPAAALAATLCVPSVAPDLVGRVSLVAMAALAPISSLLWSFAVKKMGPGYVSMDEAGLSFSLKGQSYDGGLTAVSRNESRCVDWDEIVALKVLASSFFYLYTSDGSLLTGSLVDYAQRERVELLSIIQRRAKLQPSHVLEVGRREAAALAAAIDRTVVRAEWELQCRKWFGSFGPYLFVTIRALLREPSGKDLRTAHQWMDRFSKLYCRPGYRVISMKGIVRMDELSPCNEPTPLDAPDRPNQPTPLALPVETETAETSDRSAASERQSFRYLRMD